MATPINKMIHAVLAMIGRGDGMGCPIAIAKAIDGIPPLGVVNAYGRSSNDGGKSIRRNVNPRIMTMGMPITGTRSKYSTFSAISLKKLRFLERK